MSRTSLLKNLFIGIFFLFFSITTLAGDEWKPVTPEEIAQKTPTVEPDADAEALFWEVYVADEADGNSSQTVLRHYLRIKIFTEKGREDNSKVDIPFGKISGSDVNIRIKDIAARTIKPDGSIIELEPKDIFEREIIKANRLKIKAKSFAFPGIEIGAIVEYRWKEIRGDSLSFYERLQLAREIPVHQVKYHVKPLSIPGFPYGMRIQAFNGQNTPFVKEKDGYYLTTLSNVPSFKEEPKMPPENAVRPWLLIYYAEDRTLEPEKFWQEHGKAVYDAHKSQMKVTDEVKKAAAEAVGNATEPLQKVELIFNYVRHQIKNVYDDTSGMTAEQIKKLKENRNASDTLKRGSGDWHDIDMLFAAMTTSAGFEVRVGNLPRRTEMNFSRNLTNSYFMQAENIAVKVGETWKFFSPSNRYIPFGMLGWEQEGQPTLISDSKKPMWVETPISPTEKSMEKRSGKFKLLEDGTLEGEGRIEFSGHVGAFHKEYNDDDSPAQRLQTLRNLIKTMILGSAEMTDSTIENVTDPDQPFIYTFKVRIPGYANRTGKRLFFQPNVFDRNSKPLFNSGIRKNDVFINYPWSESDDISIELPPQYQLENPDAPRLVKDGEGISSDEIAISFTKDGKFLYYKRKFSFGHNGLIYFPAKSYLNLKNLFDAFHKADSHTMTLIQK
jgi:hypothetical protein